MTARKVAALLRLCAQGQGGEQHNAVCAARTALLDGVWLLTFPRGSAAQVAPARTPLNGGRVEWASRELVRGICIYSRAALLDRLNEGYVGALLGDDRVYVSTAHVRVK